MVARNCLFTRSIGHGRALSIARQAICKANLPRGGQVVLTFLQRRTPSMPMSRISRSTAARQCMFTCTRGRAAGDVKLLTFHCMPKLARSIDRQVIVPDTLHLWTQFSVTPGTIRRSCWIILHRQMRIERPLSGHCYAMPCRAMEGEICKTSVSCIAARYPVMQWGKSARPHTLPGAL